MSFPRYPAYKPSGVEWLGEVPEHWEALPLRRLIRKVTSGTSVNAIDEPASPEQAGVLKTSCVYTGEFRPEENKAILESELDRATCPVVAGSLVVSRMNTPDLVGAAGLVKNDDPFLFLPDRLWLVSFQDCDPQFMNYWCKSVSYRSQVQLACSGTSSSMQNLSQDNFYSFIAPLPPTDEQLAVATFLDHETAKIDALIAEQQRLIELLQEKRQAVISHAVTKGLNPDAPMKASGVEWLGEVPEHWEVVRIKNVGRSTIGLTYSPDDVVDQGGGIPVLRASNIQDGLLDWDDTVFVNARISDDLLLGPGDILICARSGSRDLIGKNVLISGTDLQTPTSFGAFMTVLRCDDPSFIRWVLASTIFRSQSGAYMSTTINQLTSSVLMGIAFVLPPVEERVEIGIFLADKVQRLNALLSDSIAAIALLQERRSALISAAVTGQIDVRGLVPEAVAA